MYVSSHSKTVSKFQKDLEFLQLVRENQSYWRFPQKSFPESNWVRTMKIYYIFINTSWPTFLVSNLLLGFFNFKAYLKLQVIWVDIKIIYLHC